MQNIGSRYIHDYYEDGDMLHYVKRFNFYNNMPRENDMPREFFFSTPEELNIDSEFDELCDNLKNKKDNHFPECELLLENIFARHVRVSDEIEPLTNDDTFWGFFEEISAMKIPDDIKKIMMIIDKNFGDINKLSKLCHEKKCEWSEVPEAFPDYNLETNTYYKLSVEQFNKSKNDFNTWCFSQKPRLILLLKQKISYLENEITKIRQDIEKEYSSEKCAELQNDIKSFADQIDDATEDINNLESKKYEPTNLEIYFGSYINYEIKFYDYVKIMNTLSNQIKKHEDNIAKCKKMLNSN